MLTYRQYATEELIQAEIERLTEIDCWQNVNFESEWANVSDTNQRLMFERMIGERSTVIHNELGCVRFLPGLNDDEDGFLHGVVHIFLERSTSLLPNHRERIQETINEILQAYGTGYWECDDWDELYEFGQDGVTVTLAGYESE